MSGAVARRDIGPFLAKVRAFLLGVRTRLGYYLSSNYIIFVDLFREIT